MLKLGIADAKGNLNIGSFVQVINLEDQQKHDEWFDLFDRNDQVLGRLRVKVQWIYSQVRYIEDLLQQWQVTLQHDVEVKKQFEQSIKEMESPFGFLTVL
mmetsp:Transcript_19015/g.13812  ORF Transcript_19015/g.13812 Transcript_19015/m.13812 type:complete len:100 (-) Transcript_19015:718-1017(-)